MKSPWSHNDPINLSDEVETDEGWTFHAVLDRDEDYSRAVSFRLSWADYNLWSPAGADRPADVAKAVLRIFMESMELEAIPTKLDAARIRRLVPDADDRIPAAIRTPPSNSS